MNGSIVCNSTCYMLLKYSFCNNYLTGQTAHTRNLKKIANSISQPKSCIKYISQQTPTSLFIKASSAMFWNVYKINRHNSITFHDYPIFISMPLIYMITYVVTEDQWRLQTLFLGREITSYSHTWTRVEIFQS